MTNDLATEITGRVKKLLDGLSAIRAWRRLSTLPPLGQRLYARYSDWVDGLLSRLYSPVSSALLFSRSSNLQLLPLSYAWFDRRWNERRKRSRSFWSQSGREKDEDRQTPTVPGYFSEEAAGEDIIDQLQYTQSKPAENIILNLPTLRTLPTVNMEFTRAGQLARNILPLGIPGLGTLQVRNIKFIRPEQLARNILPLHILGLGTSQVSNSKFIRPEQLVKRIALRLELLANKGSYTTWHTPFDAIDMHYYPGLVTNDSLLDKVQGTTAGQRLSHLEETFYPSGLVDSSAPGLHPVSEQYIGTTLVPVPGEFSLAERTQIQSLYPLVPFSQRMSLNFEPSRDLPIAPGGQPVNAARIGSPSHFSETPSMISNNILVRRIFSRLQSLFSTPVVASSTNLMEEALADSPSYLAEPSQLTSDTISEGKKLVASPSYLFEPTQVASGAVLAGEDDTTPVSLPEDSPLFRRDELPDMTSVDIRYFGSLFPQLPLDRTLAHGQPLPMHWATGHISPSLTGQGISQETSTPAKAVASTIKSTSFGGYGQSTKVGLALAPVGRQRENIPAAPSSALNAGPEGAPEAAGETMPALDPEALASEVYSILKHRLIVEKERTTSAVA